VPKPLLVALEWVPRHCVVPDGWKRGEPFRPYDYQVQYLAHHYSIRDDAKWVPSDPVKAPAFAYRRSLLVGPQKVGKNPLIAVQVCIEGVGPALFAGWAGKDDGYVCADHGCGCGWEYAYEAGEPMGMPWPTPLIQITAYSQESTDNTYDALRPMIDLGPLAHVIPKTGEEFIRLPGGGRIDAVTSSAMSRLGQRVTFAPQDEVGIWTTLNKMTRVADTQYRGLAGMGGRAAMSTNAWDPIEKSVAQVAWESEATDIYRQFVQPPHNLSYSNKAERRRIHRLVYPRDTLKEHGGHVDLDSIEAEAADLAQRDLPQAQRFYGNMLVAGHGRAVDPDRWDDLAGPPPDMGTVIGLGFDGAFRRDSTCLVGCTREGRSFVLGWWENPGDRDWVVPRAEVHAAVDAAFGRYRVGLMLADPPYWHSEVEEWATKYRTKTYTGKTIERVVPFDTNQPRRMAPAVNRWLTAISEGNHTHDGDARLAAHVKAAQLRKVTLTAPDDDGRTKYVLEKGEDRRRIDGAVADVLALEAAMTMEPPEEPAKVEFIQL
jgi:hypothetical protein